MMSVEYFGEKHLPYAILAIAVLFACVHSPSHPATLSVSLPLVLKSNEQLPLAELDLGNVHAWIHSKAATRMEPTKIEITATSQLIF